MKEKKSMKEREKLIKSEHIRAAADEIISPLYKSKGGAPPKIVVCEQCIGDSLNSRQKSIIDRCVRKMYIDIARSREKYIPVMSDFYDILMAQPEEEAKEIALSLELFVNGSLNIFNHQTNVDVDNRFVVYGIRDLGTELSPITMLVMMESIQQRIVENGKRGKATWLYIDEFHVLLNSEYSANIYSSFGRK